MRELTKILGKSMNKELSLYHISQEYQALLSQLYDLETGEVNESVEAQVNALLPAVEAKCIAVVHWIKKLESEKREIEFMKTEIQKREEAYNKEIDHYQEYVKKNMEFNGFTKVSCPYFTINIKKNRHSTDVFDEFQVPSRFLKTREIVKVETKPDKEAIKEEVLRTGIQVPGAKVEQKTKLEILINKI